MYIQGSSDGRSVGRITWKFRMADMEDSLYAILGDYFSGAGLHVDPEACQGQGPQSVDLVRRGFSAGFPYDSYG